MIQTIFDIVKSHGGEIKAETKKGKGSEFIVELPGKENPDRRKEIDDNPEETKRKIPRMKD